MVVMQAVALKIPSHELFVIHYPRTIFPSTCSLAFETSVMLFRCHYP
jgi:hypothetical protein